MSSDEVARLTQLAHDAAATTPDRIADVAQQIRAANAAACNPWLLIGVLIEGIAYTIRAAIPAERRDECLSAAVRLLVKRVVESGQDRLT